MSEQKEIFHMLHSQLLFILETMNKQKLKTSNDVLSFDVIPAQAAWAGIDIEHEINNSKLSQKDCLSTQIGGPPSSRKRYFLKLQFV